MIDSPFFESEEFDRAVDVAEFRGKYLSFGNGICGGEKILRQS